MGIVIWKDVFMTKIDIWETGVQRVLRHEAMGKQGVESRANRKENVI